MNVIMAVKIDNLETFQVGIIIVKLSPSWKEFFLQFWGLLFGADPKTSSKRGRMKDEREYKCCRNFQEKDSENGRQE